jgi:hypothetical protein
VAYFLTNPRTFAAKAKFTQTEQEHNQKYTKRANRNGFDHSFDLRRNGQPLKDGEGKVKELPT